MKRFIISDNVFGMSGYAKAVRELGFALSKHMEVKILMKGMGYLPEKCQPLITTHCKFTKDDFVLIRPYFENPFQFGEAKVVANVVLESTKLPERMVKECNDDRIVQVWVPSTFCKENAVNSGIIEDKIQVIPHGYDENIFKAGDCSESYDFLFVGGYTGRGDRKGADILVESFVEEFKEGESSLYIKINKSYGDASKELAIRNDITIDTNNYIDSQMVDIYHKAKYFVAPSLSEGFNMCLLEALVCGMPVISTYFGGQHDYLISLQESERVKILLGGSKIPARFTPWDQGFWVPIEKDYLKNAMRGFFIRKPKRAKYEGIEKWSWTTVGKMAYDQLQKLAGQP